MPDIPASLTVSIADYGATPGDASDDTAAINRAILDVSSRGGGTVIVPSGVFIVNSYQASLPIFSQSRIRLKGVRDSATGALTSFLKMPRPSTNRTLMVIGNPAYADPVTGEPVNRTAVQDSVEIADIGFDLDNGRGRRAIQLAYHTNNVSIHDCEALQSGLDNGEAPDSVNRGDNHFVNLGCYYSDPVGGVVPTHISIERCKVRGNLQLTADGGFGLRDVVIRDNQVSGACSHGIAITTVATMAFFDTILIENNNVSEIAGDGLYVSIDGSNTRTLEVREGAPLSMKNLTIRNNTFALGAGSGLASCGVVIGNFTDFSDVFIENNRILGYATTASTSRIAAQVTAWDLNWERKGKNVIVAGTAIGTDGRINAPGHSFSTGMQVQFVPQTPDSVPPAGLDLYRRYRVRRIDSNSFSLVESATGSTVIPSGTASNGSSFKILFNPVVERLVARNNTIDSKWDYAWISWGAVDLTLDNNTIDGCVRILGDNEGLRVVGNRFDHDFNTGIAPTSFMPLSVLPSGRSTRRCLFENNTWTFDESRLATVALFQPGAILFNSNDAQRSLDYLFRNNTVSFATGPKAIYDNAIYDAGSTGPVTATYSGNLLNRTLGSLSAHQVPDVEESQNTPTPETPSSPSPTTPSPSAPSDSTPPPPVVKDASAVTDSVQFTNLSCRGWVGAGENAMIVGFTLEGSATTRMLVRASGPALSAFGVAGCLSDPTLALYRTGSNTPIATNDDWSSSAPAYTGISEVAQTVGAFAWARGSRDSAILMDLAPGAYTAIVRGAGETTGVALTEFYTVSGGTSTRATNLSVRLFAGTDAAKPIVGFTLTGKGVGQVLLRGCGPTLRQFGVTGTLPDPQLTLFDTGTPPKPLDANTDWGVSGKASVDQIRGISKSAGAFPFDEGSLDASLVKTLAPGSYSAVIEDSRNATGVSMVEAYLVR